MAMVVHRPALASPTDKNGLFVTEFFTEELKNSNIVLVPPSFEFSGDPNKKLVEGAEKDLSCLQGSQAPEHNVLG